MKILIVVNSLYGGGAERVASYLANYMTSGYDVHVATFSDNQKTYPLSDKVILHDIRPTSKLGIIRFCQRFFHIGRAIMNISPDVVISFSVSLNYKVLLVNKIFKRKVIVSERTSLSRYISWEADFARKHLYKTASAVVFVSHEDYCNFPFNNKTIIWNPLHFDIARSKDSVREKAVLAVGNLNRWNVKGFDNLLKAWKQVSIRHKDWELHFLGKDNDSYIHHLMDGLGISTSVKFLGQRDDVADIMQQKKIYVLSSRYEGFPNALVEAMSQGCACVAFDCQTGPKEIIHDNISGLLVKNQDVDELASKLDLLMTDYNLLHKLSEGAKKEVIRFKEKNIMAQWSELISKM